ncbi:cadherin repeat domain-containing protein, partial [archaeon]|nr:cadherin repeat domain-containing protein [archaeon]NDB55058.1 cadherin repeat domain-containing protein [archaeon]NDB78936.1 cadherin repeat domain-containing protein [archaeon]
MSDSVYGAEFAGTDGFSFSANQPFIGQGNRDTDDPGTLIFNSDGSYTYTPNEHFYGEIIFEYFITNEEGQVFGPFQLVIVVEENPDDDGIPTALEELYPSNDIDGDGIPDRKADHIASFPMTSYEDFNSSLNWANDPNRDYENAPSSSSMGSIIVGTPNSDGLYDADNTVKLSGISIEVKPDQDPYESESAVIQDPLKFSLNSADGIFNDLDNDPTNGVQVRLTIDLPSPVKASTYLKSINGEVFEYLDDQDLETFDEGATLIDANNDGFVERVVLTITDNGVGDTNPISGVIDDPGSLGLYKPDVKDYDFGELVAENREKSATFIIHDFFDNKTGEDFDVDNQKISYFISDLNDDIIKQSFAIEEETGKVTIIDDQICDFELHQINGVADFELIIEAVDTDFTVDLAKLKLHLSNVDELPFILNDSINYFDENSPVEDVAIKLISLPDFNDLPTYQIEELFDYQSFIINSTNGEIKFVSSPDYEEKSEYRIQVSATDNNENKQIATLIIKINDLDEIPPLISGNQKFTYQENSLNGIKIGKIIAEDNIGVKGFNLKSNANENEYLTVDNSGNIYLDLTSAPNYINDFETYPNQFTREVSAYDEAGNNSEYVQFTIELIDVDEPDIIVTEELANVLDSDGDGWGDDLEITYGLDPFNQDTDGDGIIDSAENLVDTDKDGIIDPLESMILDSDGDGIFNQFDVNNDNPYSDSDGDGYSDLEETEDLKRTGSFDLVDPLDSSKYPPWDHDKDYLCDWHDKDDDNDLIEDDVDNCHFEFNPDQSDFDNDGVGDVCDDDIDGDSVLNVYDNCPQTPVEDVVDLDGCSIFYLSADNFSISKTEKCAGENSITLSVIDGSIEYDVAFKTYESSSSDKSTRYFSFSGNKFELESLSAGTYSLCITAAGVSSSEFERCFEVTITEPDPLS